MYSASLTLAPHICAHSRPVLDGDTEYPAGCRMPLMERFLPPFIALSAIGLIFSVVAHVSALLGYDLGVGTAVFALHFGVFVVWVPAVFAMQKITGEFKQRDMWKAALRGCPGWMKKMLYGFAAYAAVNFLLLAASGGRMSTQLDVSTPAVVRGFSGHWMAFYAAALAILYSARYAKQADARRRCGSGHLVSPMAKYCEECGALVRR